MKVGSFEYFTWISAMSWAAIYRPRNQCAAGIPAGEKVEPVTGLVGKESIEVDFFERHSCVFFRLSQLMR
ncbi:hypothetical protein [Marinomonas rhizomae]|uniref:Uncharacterized protein n=1 Tax=Marinomonas rhizomae TaxID=491948 RepID=A0A366J852_9GAMM|nr:hypothetical protein [Marinomonas rhizomae]RBP82415.1 hypothetical protein DFP80_10861 [Marinomonas rhizomae]